MWRSALLTRQCVGSIMKLDQKSKKSQCLFLQYIFCLLLISSCFLFIFASGLASLYCCVHSAAVDRLVQLGDVVARPISARRQRPSADCHHIPAASSAARDAAHALSRAAALAAARAASAAASAAALTF